MSKPSPPIVIGTSLAQASDGAVRTGAAVARTFGAAPWLVHAYAVPVFPSEIGIVNVPWIEEQVTELRQRALAQARRTGLDGVPGFTPAHVVLAPGVPQREITRLAEEKGAELIVVGAQDEPSRRRVLGSTADRVVRKARCPVLVVRSAIAFPPVKVEIPVDLSPVSAAGLRRGLDFLDRLGVSGDQTEVLFVLNPFETGGSVHFTPEQVQRFAAEELRRFADAHARGRLRPAALQVRSGFARQEILTALEAREVDLAVLGTHGRSGFDRLVLGSVAAGVLHEAGCNLLVVPPGEAAAREPAIGGTDWEYVSDERPALAGTGAAS